MGKRDLASSGKEDKKRRTGKTAAENPKITSCGEEGCNYESKWATTVKRHKAMVHDIDVTFYLCGVNECQYKAKHAGSVKRHKTTIHGIS